MIQIFCCGKSLNLIRLPSYFKIFVFLARRYQSGQIVIQTSMQINREAAAISLSSVCEITAECGQAGSNVALSSWK